MGQIAIGESGVPATPGEGVVLYPTVATPSIFKMVDDAGVVYTFALLEKAQTFTTTQTIAPTSTAVKALVVNVPTGAAALAQEWQLNAAQRAYVNISSTANQVGLSDFDAGASIGPTVVVGRNNNATTTASGTVRITNKGGTDYYLWVDTAGKLRIGTTAPTSANDVTGTIVGTQT